MELLHLWDSLFTSRPSRQWTTVFYPAVIATLFGRVWAQNYNHGQKSWDTFAFLGRFPIHTGPTTPLIPQNNVGRVYPDFFASFNFKVLYMQKLRCNYNINICNPSNFKKFFSRSPLLRTLNRGPEGVRNNGSCWLYDEKKQLGFIMVHLFAIN